MKYLNNQDVFDFEIKHNWNDYSYEVPQARQLFEEYTSPEAPPAILGWGTADTNLLAPRVKEKEIIYISASYSAKLHEGETPYNFFGNLDYTSQLRVLLRWIKDNDPDAKAGIVYHEVLNYSLEGAEQYAESIDLDMGPSVQLGLGASTAETQVRRMKEENVDYILGHVIWSPFLVLLRSIRDGYPEANVMASTWGIDERATEESPELFEGARFMNAFKTFNEVLETDQGGEAVRTSLQNYRKEGAIEDPSIANLNYIRGFVHALILVGGIQKAQEAGLDVSKGANIREGMFMLDEWDNWGMSLPFDYKEGDRRCTMSGRVYRVEQGGTFTHEQTVSLSRKDEWLGV
jgi:branched-chain amino acid transport system substrate-binding protein